jgi:signal transduction histidine kinase
MEDGVLLVEWPSRRVILANTAARELLGWTEKNVPLLSEGRGAESALLEIAERVNTYPDQHPEGELGLGSRFAKVRGSAARSGSGEPMGCLFTLVDVTREREVELLREDLSSMIVHDLRTPLTTTIASLETLAAEEETESAETRRELIEIGLSGARSLLHLVNTLLDISRLESGEVPIERAEANLSDLTEAALAQVTPLVEEAGLQLLTDINKTLPSVWVDKEKMQRVLVNLLGNAVKFTPSGGRITVSVCDDSRPRGWVLVSVEDTGEGVPEEYHERIFDKFEQVAIHKSGRRMSTGLGLTFCKLAVEAHGGRIWVESPLFHDKSSGEPRGSRFTFSLPTAPPNSRR